MIYGTRPSGATEPEPAATVTDPTAVRRAHDGYPDGTLVRRTHRALTAPRTFVSDSFASPKSRDVF